MQKLVRFFIRDLFEFPDKTTRLCFRTYLRDDNLPKGKENVFVKEN